MPMELVAPAGEIDSFRLALAHGADAIYLGGKSFSARSYARNFDWPELAGAIRLAHLHRVRVYVTMNTLLRTEEMEEAVAQARRLQEAGADAVIVQDLGFLLALRESLPGLRLHASTQMTVANGATLAALARLGVSRAVLAREATRAEIERLAGVGPEIEVFVHGALCYSYSGQCLMSSLIGGRSGNRGRCAQPCRMAYALVGPDGRETGAETGRYLLSPRDLCLLPHLPALRAAGVQALKIEGRMKRPEYVGTVVRVYRRALDRLEADPEGFLPTGDELRDLEQIFNRGFTPGFFAGDRGASYLSLGRPNNRGRAIGRVAAVDARRGLVEVDLEAGVHREDGIEIWVSRGGRLGCTLAGMTRDGRPVETAEAGERIALPLREKAVRPGDRVFRTNDARLNAQAWAPLRRGDLDLFFRADFRAAVGGAPVLVLTDAEGHRAQVVGETPGQPARNRPLDEAVVREQLSRTGGSGWRPAAMTIEIAPGTMLPLSELNRLRRAGLAALEEARLASFPPLAGVPAAREGLAGDEPCPPPGPRKTGLSATVGNPEEARAALEADLNRLYLASWLHDWPEQDLAGLRMEAARRGTLLVYALPRVVPEREADLWRAEMDRARRAGLDGLRLGDLGQADAAGPVWRERLYFDFSLNVANARALRYLGHRAAAVALSPELTLAQDEEVAASCPGRAEILAHGRIELMLSAHCLLGAVAGGKDGPGQTCRRPCARGGHGLRDRTGAVFPLVPDRFCRLHLTNSVDLSVLPELERVARCGADLRLELHGRGPRYAARVAAAYREGLRLLAAGRWTRAAGEALEKGLAEFSPAGFTRGHFFRGVE